MRELFGVIGNPIGHSLSPVMHEKWLEQNKLDHHYHAFSVRPADLESAVRGFRSLGVKGFNVTIPYKLAIIPFLDEIDEEAKRLGAVNTVINNDRTLIGTNTDGVGFINSLHAKGIKLSTDQKVLMIGAGGAARAVSLALAHLGIKRVDIANRSKEKAEILCEEVSRLTQSQVNSLDEASLKLADYQIVVNATPVGMSGISDELPLPIDHLEKGTLCIDLIYRPLQTRFLVEATRIGCQTMNGLPMLIHQGAAAFKKWLGIEPDTEEMEFYLSQKLK